jgi:hypothetical protein
MITTTPVDQSRILKIMIGDHRKGRLWQVIVDVSVHTEEQVDDGRPLRVCLKSQPPRPWNRLSGLISVMGHDEQVCEGDIPAHHPVGILEEGRINGVADGLRGPLIGRHEGTAVHLIMGQRIDPLLELLNDFIDCRCCLAGRASVHGVS